MRKLITVLPLLALVCAGCGTTRSALEKLTDFVPGRDLRSRKIVLNGYVCKPAEKIHDSSGIDLGLRFVAAPVGQSCDLGAREIYIAAVSRSEMEKSQRLVVGQSVTVRGELAERTLTLERLTAPAGGDVRLLNEAIAADSIHVNR
jgi:hypothetical protein